MSLTEAEKLAARKLRIAENRRLLKEYSEETRRDPRCVWRFSETNTKELTILTPLPLSHLESRDKHKYNIMHKEWVLAIDTMLNGGNSAYLLRYIANTPPIISLPSGEKKRDAVGDMMSELERYLFQLHNKMSFISPTDGTLLRFEKYKRPFVVYLPKTEVLHDYYTSSPKDRKADLERMIGDMQMNGRVEIVDRMSDLPDDDLFYVGTRGHLVHELQNIGRRAVGVGINLNVIKSSGEPVTVVEDNDIFTIIKTYRNGNEILFKTYKDTKTYGYHMTTVIPKGIRKYEDVHKLYNLYYSWQYRHDGSIVESTTRLYMETDKKCAYPKNVYTALRVLEGKEVEVFCILDNNHEQIVDVISPPFEYETRRRMCRDYKYHPKVGEEHLVATSLAPVFVLTTKETFLGKRYKIREFDFPSLYYYNGAERVLRAFPSAFRAEKSMVGKIQIDMGGTVYDGLYTPKVDGIAWVYYENGKYNLVPRSIMFNDDLQVYTTCVIHASVEDKCKKTCSRSFFQAGNVTKEYYEDPDGETYCMVDYDYKFADTTYVSVKMDKDTKISGHHLNFTDNGVVRLYSFSSAAAANFFYRHNKEINKNVWLGIIGKFLDVLHPLSKRTVLYSTHDYNEQFISKYNNVYDYNLDCEREDEFEDITVELDDDILWYG